MKVLSYLTLLLLLITACDTQKTTKGIASSQKQQYALGQQLLKDYPQFKETTITDRRVAHQTVQQLLQQLPTSFEVVEKGTSIEGRKIYLVSIGEGDIDVLLWSQMHGDEVTATMALMDIFNFLKDTTVMKEEKAQLLSEVKLHFIPMLNPDGAERFQRRNALGVDINRDALRLQSPEAQILKQVRDSLKADFGFNLHDQSRYYSAGDSDKPATISFLAPAYNEAREINQKRKEAMQVIAVMNQALQQQMPGQVAKYDDTFEPRAFGDNIQKWGTRTILIESGGYPQDREKQYIRQMNYLAILSALFSIAEEGYKAYDIAEYHALPENQRKLLDLKLSKVRYPLNGKEYLLDLGIRRNESIGTVNDPFVYVGRITDVGDLSTSTAYQYFDAEGLRLQGGKVYPKVFQKVEEIGTLDMQALLKEGYTYVKVKELAEEKRYAYLLPLLAEDQEPSRIGYGSHATFLLKRGEVLEAAVVNGVLIKFSENVVLNK
ncbi:M14 metallopeptidase family protein [Algivirga pacifica]|uniref:Peptidase M14 domain-containing protein n=1 Tax=Algivirga pacifica TaxID=1162670 RepID=A0ABP9D773_9BACT